MRKYAVAIFIFLFYVNSFSQTKENIIYKDLVFEKIAVTKNIQYRNAPAGTKENYSLLDLYEATEDSNSLRPLIIWIHGGGFKYGHKKSFGIPVWSKTFAQRGYLCAAINYRLSKKKPLRKFPDLVDGCIEGIEDVNDVISFLKLNARKYRVDTSMIILAGNSAGAIIALQAVYSSPYELAKLVNKSGYDPLSREHNSNKIACILSFWGALFDSSWLKNADVPIALIHGSKDKIISPEINGPVNGSKVIYRNAIASGIPVTLKLYDKFRHELQRRFNPLWAGGKTKKRWLEAGQFTADFLYDTLLRKQ